MDCGKSIHREQGGSVVHPGSSRDEGFMRKHEKRILLMTPPFYRLFKDTYALIKYPLSLGCLAAALKSGTDWEVLAYNTDFAPAAEPFDVLYLTGKGFREYLAALADPSAGIWREVKSVIAAYAPSVVGISCTSPTFASAMVTASLVREIDPEITVVAGGPHPTAAWRQVLENPHIDLCVAGEGERTVVNLVKALEPGIAPATIKGICYRNKQRIAATPGQPAVADLDSLGFPHESAPAVLHDYECYPPSAFKYIMATRGCPNRCFFCGSHEIWGRRVRFRSPENVVAEIRGLQRMGLNYIHFDDDTFGVSSEYLTALTGEIERQCPDLSWSCETHVRLMTPENLRAMKAAGCTMIQLGIESGNNRILKLMRKGFSIEEARSACALIRKHDIGLETFFMAGFPHETEASIRETLKAIEEIECDKVIYSIFTPYPGTEAFAFCRARGLIGDEFDLSRHCHQSPANAFCTGLAPERFRSLASKIEHIVSEKNRASRLPR
jgi:radical SAM superfamily enzyme YgiQ (UPF0313 family)